MPCAAVEHHLTAWSVCQEIGRRKPRTVTVIVWRFSTLPTQSTSCQHSHTHTHTDTRSSTRHQPISNCHSHQCCHSYRSKVGVSALTRGLPAIETANPTRRWGLNSPTAACCYSAPFWTGDGHKCDAILTSGSAIVGLASQWEQHLSKC